VTWTPSVRNVVKLSARNSPPPVTPTTVDPSAEMAVATLSWPALTGGSGAKLAGGALASRHSTRGLADLDAPRAPARRRRGGIDTVVGNWIGLSIIRLSIAV